MPRRHRIAGAICLVLGGSAVVLQYLVTPLTGSMTGSELVAKATDHHAAMGWALALDFPVLLAAPAFLYVGHVARARTSVLASLGGAFLFFPFVLSLPALLGLDALAWFAGSQPNKAAMADLVDAWQGSAWFAISLVPYVLLQVTGAVLLAVALVRQRIVPLWVALGTAAWPLIAVAGQESGVRALGLVGYGLLLVTWIAFALTLLRDPEPAAAEATLVTA